MVLTVKKNKQFHDERRGKCGWQTGRQCSRLLPPSLLGASSPATFLYPSNQFRCVVMNTGFSGEEGLCYLKTLQGLPRKRTRAP